MTTVALMRMFMVPYILGLLRRMEVQAIYRGFVRMGGIYPAKLNGMSWLVILEDLGKLGII